MKRNTLTIGIASVITMGVIAYFLIKNSVREERLTRVADEGYETAYDILYPLKPFKLKKY